MLRTLHFVLRTQKGETYCATRLVREKLHRLYSDRSRPERAAAYRPAARRAH